MVLGMNNNNNQDAAPAQPAAPPVSAPVAEQTAPATVPSAEQAPTPVAKKPAVDIPIGTSVKPKTSVYGSHEQMVRVGKDALGAWIWKKESKLNEADRKNLTAMKQNKVKL